ncbi:vitronectin [Pseudophryne corroboree]|uniref:vitronectin n=1 Tax=Pseudophryne corroboree TaxID=495146 RepID=UPI00308174CF
MRALLLQALLLLGAISSGQAAEESCAGRCFDGFNANNKCQCDTLCTFYQSCCSDYKSFCKPKETRGDVFDIPEDEYNYDTSTPVSMMPSTDNDLVETTEVTTFPVLETEEQKVPATTEQPDQPVTKDYTEELCSGKPFDAFTNLKNGSVYAFRGKYFYELDDKRALDGYPKLIKDVWGIEGPIDAAFTRMNCQGKTYLFKGIQYWRFSDGILDSDYPRDIEDGFKNIPNYIDAAFALPANDIQGTEKAFFFKGNKYWQYEFANQPTMEECTASSPSEIFTQYVEMQDDSWELFSLLFGTWLRDTPLRSQGPKYISKDWKGVPNGVDAVLPSRIYVQEEKSPSLRRSKRRKSKRRKSRKRRPSLIDMLDDMLDDDDEYDPDWLPPPSRAECQPVQSVYFFKKDKYYRVNLQTKRVDYVYPRYPRPIAEYWLGCEKSCKEKKSLG